jgi:hypothetical protein
MPYATPTPEQRQRFNEDGFPVVENAIDPHELDVLVRMRARVTERPLDPKANDLDWRRGEPREKRAYRIVQSAVDRDCPWLVTSQFLTWDARFAATDVAESLSWKLLITREGGPSRIGCRFVPRAVNLAARDGGGPGASICNFKRRHIHWM